MMRLNEATPRVIELSVVIFRPSLGNLRIRFVVHTLTISTGGKKNNDTIIVQKNNGLS